MEIRPIKNHTDYRSTLAEIENLFGAEPDTPDGDRLEVLVTLVEAYEVQHHNVPLPNPIEAILYYMDSRGLTRKDLEPYIGSRARVSEILNRKRPLSLNMIRRLEAGLGIPAETLIQSYALAESGAQQDVDIPTTYHRVARFTMAREDRVEKTKAAIPLEEDYAPPDDQQKDAAESDNQTRPPDV